MRSGMAGRGDHVDGIEEPIRRIPDAARPLAGLVENLRHGRCGQPLRLREMTQTGEMIAMLVGHKDRVDVTRLEAGAPTEGPAVSRICRPAATAAIEPAKRRLSGLRLLHNRIAPQVAAQVRDHCG